MADKIDNAVFKDMKTKTKKKSDDFLKTEFDFDTFIEKGDSLYQEYANKTQQFHKRFPDIPMFDEKGGETPEFKKAWEDAGERSVRYTGQTARQAHFEGLYNKIEKGMSSDDHLDFTSITIPYGKNPRYSSRGTMVSPYMLFDIYKKKTKGMRELDKAIEFDPKFSQYIESLSTDRPDYEEDLREGGGDQGGY